MESSENKRKRLTQACELCRRKKIKCDGIKPNCGNCMRLNSECVYSASMKKRGPRQGYIELLEQRLAKMEKILLSSDAPQEEEPNHVLEEPKRKKRGKAPSEDHRQTSSPTSFSSITSSFPSPPPHILLQSTDEDVLPSADIIEHATDLYFAFLYPFCPLFDETSFRKDVKEGKCSDFLLLCLLAACARFSERPDIKKNPSWSSGEVYADKARPLILKTIDEPSISGVQAMVLLTLHEFGCGRGPRTWMYGGMATRMVIELGYHENIENESVNPTIDKLREQESLRKVFWCVFTLDKFSTAATGRPSAISEKFCTALLPAKVTPTQCSGQYYTESLNGDQYLLLNISCVRKSQLFGSYVDNTREEHQSEKKPNLELFAYFVRATSILGRVTAFVNKKKKFEANMHPCHPDSEIMKLDKTIEDWYRDLPMELKNTSTNFELQNNANQQSILILLHILYNTLVILLHRPAMVAADTLDSDIILPELKSFITKSLSKCMEAMDNVTVLVERIGQKKELMPPYLTYLVYTVATVVVSVSFSPKEEEAQKAKKSLPAYMKFLVFARNYWAMADKLYFMIRDLYTIHDRVLKAQSESATQQATPELYQQSPPNLFQPQQCVSDLFSDSNTPGAASINDWNLPYYNNAMSESAPNVGFYNELNNPLNFAGLQELSQDTGIQIPGGFNLGFSYYTDTINQNNNG